MSKSSNGPKTSRFGENLLLSMIAMEAAEDEQDDREVMEEYHLDCQGKKRLFRIQSYGGGVATFLTAQEILEDGDPGMRVLLRFNEETEPPPYFELRTKIEERLAVRDLIRDPDSGRLEALTGLIRASITSDRETDLAPMLVIDGEQVSWEEFGRLLTTYEGWGLHIRITSE